MFPSYLLWRFRNVAKPREERGAVLEPKELRFEKLASGSIAVFLLLLALGNEVSAIVGLAKHDEPDGSKASLIVSASALVLIVLLWLPKVYLAKLDSSAMQAETRCSLSCIQITIILFTGALVYRLWKGAWWVDKATSILLGFLFGWEGWKGGRRRG